jgi:hypothetical protein
MSAVLKTALETGIADPVYHERLMSDIHGVAKTANIPESYVWTSIHKYCEAAEVKYVSEIKRHMDSEDPVFGMVYRGKIEGSPINDRMMSIAGMCLRNYINAKVMTLQEVLASIKNSDMPSPTVLLIPNFYLSKGSGGHIADWEVSSLIGLLYKRQQEEQQTVVYVGDWDGMKLDYGQVFADHLGFTKFVKITTEMTTQN